MGSLAMDGALCSPSRWLSAQAPRRSAGKKIYGGFMPRAGATHSTFTAFAGTLAPSKHPPVSMVPRSFRIIVVVAWLSAGLPLHAAEPSGNVALTSDYVFRGVSQTDAAAAWQGGVRIDGASGVYGSVWASRVRFASAPGASAEIDYAAGVQHALGEDWVGDFNATWFSYAGASSLDYLEWIATATWRGRR
jgi:hypothetical protein